MNPLRIAIVSPALADANNGNWQTARRWQRLLQPHRARIVRQWPDAQADGDAVMLALHARRSADSIQAWHARHGQRGLGVVLTGTDLYRDIAHDPQAQRSLDLAHSLVVLQGLGVQSLPSEHQAKARVIFQSTGTRQTLPKTSRHLRVVMVGHLREEKDPLSLMAAARLLPPDAGVLIDHIGAPLDQRWATQLRPRRRSARTTAGWGRCRMPTPCSASSARTCWCTAAAWKAARMC